MSPAIPPPEFEFFDELPARIRTNPDGQTDRWIVDRFAAALMKRPGVWGKWPIEIRSSTVSSYATQIRAGTMRAFREGSYEALARNRVLYVRYLGEGEQ